MNKLPLIILTGPTAVGKTKASINLAKMVGGEIISADSMQVYRQMDIGSAKITKEEMQGVPHYLVDVMNPDEDFSVAEFQKLAKEAMKKIYENHHIPIIVGGTGFYIQAILYDIDFTSCDDDDSYRKEMEEFAKENGAEALHELLKKTDPASAEAIHANNVKRVIRALEFYHQTGKLMSEHNEEERKKESPYNYAYFVLNDDRNILYERIDKRVDSMVKEGLVEEVENLHNAGYHKNMVSMQGLGYKEILEYLTGECTLDEAVYKIKRDTRHFAKRQLTWFRRERDVIWVDRSKLDNSEEKILDFMLKKLQEREMI